MTARTNTSMPPTCSTASVVPFGNANINGGVQYADMSCKTPHEVQLYALKSSYVVVKWKSFLLVTTRVASFEGLCMHTVAAVYGMGVLADLAGKDNWIHPF